MRICFDSLHSLLSLTACVSLFLFLSTYKLNCKLSWCTIDLVIVIIFYRYLKMCFFIFIDVDYNIISIRAFSINCNCRNPRSVSNKFNSIVTFLQKYLFFCPPTFSYFALCIWFLENFYIVIKCITFPLTWSKICECNRSIKCVSLKIMRSYSYLLLITKTTFV